MLDKVFDYTKFESKYSFKEESESRTDGEPFMILLPPPNVTGSLHIGHSLCYTLQDILARYKRGRGFNVLFQPGLDHAGIVTQLLVERKLAEKGISRVQLGREKFVEEIWKWKEESGGNILHQMDTLGISCDMSKLCFTMDEQRQKAVAEYFVKLYKDGLIYKAKRLVNWDPKLQSAISDLEVVEKEESGNLWHINYKIKDSDETITVATTRPETMFGDSGIAVHPDDERYKHLIGKFAILPICDRIIPIVADEYANPEKGTGAVKITPAHDFNDFEVGQRHNLEVINIMTKDASLNENVPPEFRGLDRFEARKKVVSTLEEIGILVDIQKISHKVPYSDRSGVILEPYVTEQWFVDAEKLAGPALEAVTSGKTEFVPKHWENLYFEWLKNIRPWCISRQIWWGHRIPVWYGEDGHMFVCTTEEQAYDEAKKFYGKSEVKLERENDVLDTWFSSGLWPFATLGWPNENQDLEKFYGNAVVVTGFDIIFFWVARMMMSGMYIMKKPPFKKIYIHGLVRDEKGQKMSKSKGNVIDPLNLCKEYGADAVRFTLAYLASPGRDVKMNSKTVEFGRNFLTKIWNAVRFAQMNNVSKNSDFDISTAKSDISRWIIKKTGECLNEYCKALDDYRFDDAAQVIYHFVWDKFCDWFLEFSKPILQSENVPEKEEILSVTAWVIEQITGILYPICPFISQVIREEISTNQMAFPSISVPENFSTSENKIDFVCALITKIRSLKKELNIAQKDVIEIDISEAKEFDDFISQNKVMLEKLGKCNLIDDSLKQGISSIVYNIPVKFFVGDLVDIPSEIAKLKAELEKLEKDKESVDCRLNNKGFLAKASKEVLEEHIERLALLNEKMFSVRLLIEDLSRM